MEYVYMLLEFVNKASALIMVMGFTIFLFLIYRDRYFLMGDDNLSSAVNNVNGNGNEAEIADQESSNDDSSQSNNKKLSKKRKFIRLIAIIFIAWAVVMFISKLANAQTAIAPPNANNQVAQNQTANNQIGSNNVVPGQADFPKKIAPPISNKNVQQAKKQQQGNFPKIDREVSAGGQIQEAWNTSDRTAGVINYNYCADCSYKVTLREFMITTIVLNQDVHITKAHLGDDSSFLLDYPAPNIVTIKPLSYGIDTNLIIYTKSGSVYPVYLQAQAHNSDKITDMMVRIKGALSDFTAYKSPHKHKNKSFADAMRDAISTPPKSNDDSADPASTGPAESSAPTGSNTGSKGKSKSSNVDPSQVLDTSDNEIIRDVPFDPSKIRGFSDYKLWGDESMKPKLVYRDDIYTYIRYNKNFINTSAPRAYVVYDGIDELTNIYVEGDTIVVQSVAPVITLKNGDKFICIQYIGDEV